MTAEKILQIYNSEKQKLLNVALKNNGRKYGVTDVDIECVLDDLPLKVINSKATFENTNKLKSYLYTSLHRNIAVMYARKRIDNMPPLTDNERQRNYQLAKDIVNYNRSIKKSPD